MECCGCYQCSLKHGSLDRWRVLQPLALTLWPTAWVFRTINLSNLDFSGVIGVTYEVYRATLLEVSAVRVACNVAITGSSPKSF